MPPPPKLTGSNSFNQGDHVFFKHPVHSWIVGKVTDVKDTAGTPAAAKVRKYITCKADDELRECTGESHEKLDIDKEVAPCREDLLDEQPHDLLTLTVLHDATLLRCLYARYMRDVVYTNIGAIVVALNPFNFKIPWYMDDQMKNYLAEGSVIEKNIPHSWAQAHNTYNEMIADSGNQCILISGESGAGKTEATKIVMKYLAQISCLRGTDAERAAGMEVGGKLNQCSPILESFGNAKTVRNDNSSRFGKFMKVKFNDTGLLVGAHVTKYLLEKSRIITASKNERVYHSFYIAARGSYAREFELEPDVQYRSLIAGQCMQNSEFNTPEHFTEVKEAMLGIGMTEDEIRSVWACTCGIMSSLNVQFLADGEGSKVDGKTEKYLDRAVTLWKVKKEDFEKELRTTVMEIAGDKTTKLLRPELANDIRDATAKALYDALFSSLVEKCNEKCDVEATGNWIGLLDIFGFEDFEKNSFEQICINLANETLQNHYNNYIFTRDMEECKAEGVDVTDIKCPDNKPCLDMISAKGGIMSLLDEECMLGKSTDLTFLAKVEAAFTKHAFFDKKKSSRDTFIIHHYAASVTYDVNGWLDKNRDTLKDDIRRCMRNSEDTLIKELLDAPLAPDQKKGRVTVGGFFKEQVALLMEVINSTNPHWIRCVKPHPAKKPRKFDGIQTMNQLESSGVLGTVKIRKAGYPIRVVFDKFTVRYKIMAQAAAAKKTGKDLCVEILKAAQMEGKQHAQIGKTKVFMKAEAFPTIERKRNEALQSFVLTMQRFGQGYLGRLNANKEWCNSIQKKAAKMFVEEYRSYLKRSATVREERARIRREIEEKFRGLKLGLEREFGNFFDSHVSQYEQDLERMKAQLEKDLEAERKRQEQFRGAREAFYRQEYVARGRLFDESLSEAMSIQDLYGQELRLFRELELAVIEESAKGLRIQIMSDEREARNVLWRGLQKMQAASELDSYMVFTLQGLNTVAIAEQVNRDEMNSRMRLLKQELKIRMTFRTDEQMNVITAKKREKAHKMYDKQKDYELNRLRELYHSELNRVEDDRRRALMQVEAADPSLASSSSHNQQHHQRNNNNQNQNDHDGVANNNIKSSSKTAAGRPPTTGGTGSNNNKDSAAIAALFGTPNHSPQADYSSRGSALAAGGNNNNPNNTKEGSDPRNELEQYSPALVRAAREAYGNQGQQNAAAALDYLSASPSRTRLIPNEHAHWYDIDTKLTSSSNRAVQNVLLQNSANTNNNNNEATTTNPLLRSTTTTSSRTQSAGISYNNNNNNRSQSGRGVSTSFLNTTNSNPHHHIDPTNNTNNNNATNTTRAGSSSNAASPNTRSRSSRMVNPMANLAGSQQISARVADNFLFGSGSGGVPPRGQPIIPSYSNLQQQQRQQNSSSSFITSPQQVGASPLGRLTASTADMMVFGGSPASSSRTRRYY